MSEIILLVEDDTAVLNWLKKSLTYGTGAHVEAVDTVAKALTLVHQLGSSIAALVCDLQMDTKSHRPQELKSYPSNEPGGFIFAQWVKNQLPTVGVYGMTGLMRDANQNHADWFVTASDPQTGVGVYHKYLQWPLLRHRVFTRVGRQSLVTVFIVHGHDPASNPPVRDELAHYVRGNLKWHPEILQLGQWGMQTWIEQIERYAETAQMAWVLLTPDEWACPCAPDLLPERRPRPNVLFECGYFLGAFGRLNKRVLLFRKGSVAIPSDLDGIPRVELKGSVANHDAEIRQKLAAWL